MKITLSVSDISKIVAAHLESKGYELNGCESNYSDSVDYEYYGDPQNEQRREVKYKLFEGLSYKVKSLK